MAQAAKKPKVERDSFTPDGVRLFNPSLEHGVVYADGFIETKFIQEYQGREVHYRGDHTPVGYVEGEPMPPPVDEVQAENKALKDRIASLEAAIARIEALQAAPKSVATVKGGKSAAGKPSEAPADGARPLK